jgi:hypothetical protein
LLKIAGSGPNPIGERVSLLLHLPRGQIIRCEGENAVSP